MCKEKLTAKEAWLLIVKAAQESIKNRNDPNFTVMEINKDGNMVLIDFEGKRHILKPS